MLPIIKEECIILDLEAKSKNEILQKMVDVLDDNDYISDKDQFYKDVLKREEIFPTYLGYNIGIPHGKSNAVNHAGLCIARLKDYVQWDDNEENKVDFVILIAVKEKEDNNLHLKILAKLSRLLMHDDFRDLIRSIGKKELYDILINKLEV